MGYSVKLSEIIDAIELQTSESSAYLNKKTGEIVTVTDEDFEAAENQDPLDEYPEWQHESIKAAHEILAREEDFLSMPTKYDIHEYEIMEKFCLSTENREISETLFRAKRGKGAFRRFKDYIQRLNLTDDWHKFREESIKQIAIDWCESNRIKFEDK